MVAFLYLCPQTASDVGTLQNALYRGEKEKGRKLVEAYDLECGPLGRNRTCI